MSTIKTETLSTPSNATVPVDTVVNGTAKAWVNFNGTGTVAIRRAFNVSSITDQGTGLYAVNFTNAMPDANFATTALARYVNGTGIGTVCWTDNAQSTSSTGQIVTAAVNASYTARDTTDVYVTIFS